MDKSKELAVLILAAGTSSRLGEAKQLLEYKNKTLLWHACKKAKSISEDVFVVLGARFEECKKEIKAFDVEVIKNSEYKFGLATSIKAGIKRLKEYKKVLIMLCDQPFIPKEHFLEIVQRSEKNNIIICSSYNNKLLVPALFPKDYFDELLSLEGDVGAKKVIMKNKNEAVELKNSFAMDIDTQEDKKYLESLEENE